VLYLSTHVSPHFNPYPIAHLSLNSLREDILLLLTRMLQTKTCIYIADLYCCLYYYYPTCSSAKRWEFSTLSDYSASGVKRVLWQLSSADICGNLQHVVGPKHAVCDTRSAAVCVKTSYNVVCYSHSRFTDTYLACQTLSIGRALIRKWDARDTAIETAVWQLQPKGVQTV